MPTPQITIRISKEELARWKAKAKSENLDVSSMIRALVRKHITGEDPEG